MKWKLTPDMVFVLLVAVSILLRLHYPSLLIITYPISTLGFVFILVGLWLVASANSALLKNQTSIHPYTNPTVLITSGVFKRSRNPIYLGMINLLVGIEIILGSWVSFLFPILLFTFLHFLIVKEEDRLKKLFGEPYTSYKKEVRRWL